MKPKPTLPKGRVAWFAPDWTYWAKTRLEEGSFPVAVIPCRTRAQARAIIKLHNTPREELVGRVAKSIFLAKWGIGWDKLLPAGKAHWRTLAEAAVKEILP